MFEKLKNKWGVTGTQLTLILVTFAIGGSLCAKAGGFLLGLIFSEKGLGYWILYIPILTILWPSCVIFISIFTGQYRFFISYLQKIGKKMGLIK
jgi:uncharacterized membrane protein YwzB